jgi:hypothetical protein
MGLILDGKPYRIGGVMGNREGVKFNPPDRKLLAGVKIENGSDPI